MSGTIVSTLVVVVTVPYVVQRLGVEPYGLLALLLSVGAYVRALDFGFSWGTTRFVADALEREADTADVLRAALLLFAALGVVGGTLLVVLAAPLVRHVFNVGASLQGPGVDTGRILGIGFAFFMLQLCGLSALRGARRFDLATAVQLLASIGASVAMVAAVAAGGRLVAVGVAVAGAQAAAGCLSLATAAWLFGPRAFIGLPRRATLGHLTRFSTAVGVSTLGSQLLYLPNRLAVGVLLPLRTVTAFTIPTTLAQRLLVVPNNLGGAGVPTLTAAWTRRDVAEFRQTVDRMVNWTLGLSLPLAGLAFVWAPTLLRVWLHVPLAGGAGWVLRLVIVGVLLNGLASVLATACSSAGRPWLPARATLVAGAVNIPLAFLLTHLFGIVGAAAALSLSLGVLLVGVVVAWRQAALLPTAPGRKPTTARGAAFVVCACAWVAAAVIAEPYVQSRGTLVFVAVGLVAAGYCGIAALAGGRDLVTRFPTRWTAQRP